MESNNSHSDTLIDYIHSEIFQFAGIPTQPPFADFSQSCHVPNPSNLPWITATWAQSLDSRISGPDKKSVAISGRESLVMTHMLRSVHDAILVGIGTVLSDNPKLSVRLNEILGLSRTAEYKITNPQPIILDASLSIPLNCRLLTDPTVVRPWIITDTTQMEHPKAMEIQQLGGKVIFIPDARSNLHQTFLTLRLNHGIKSVMVEGGAKVLNSVLELKLASCVIITIAPMFLGGHCTSLEPPGHSCTQSTDLFKWTALGSDMVLSYFPCLQ